jgi:hypothetical protein
MSNQPTVFELRPPCYPYSSVDIAIISYLVATYEVLMLLLSWPNIVSTRVEPWTILCVEEDVNSFCLGKCDDLTVMMNTGVIKK